MAGKANVVRGALSALTDIGSDITRRDFMKGVGATAATGALVGLKGAPKLFDDLAPVAKKAVKAIPKLPKSIYDLPSYIETNRYVKNDLFQTQLDLLSNDADNLEEIQGLIYEAVENSGKKFDYFGINPNKIEFKDAYNEKLLDETDLAESYVQKTNYGYPFDDIDLLKEDAEIITRWLNDEIPLANLYDTEGGGVGWEVINDLMKKYKMSKPQIKKYLEKNDILEGE